MLPETHNPLHDTESIKTNAAWFAAGSGAFGSYLFVTIIVVGGLTSLVAAIFHLDAGTAVAGMTSILLVSIAVIAFYLDARSRTIARTQSVQVDRF